MKTIGKSFYSELVAAGLDGLPFSWGEDGSFEFSDSMTDEQIAAVNAVYAAHDPTAHTQIAKVMTALSFIEQFTPEEQLAVVTAAMQSAELRLWYDKLMAADQVVFDDPRLLEGMGVIVAAGLITQARHDEILSL